MAADRAKTTLMIALIIAVMIAFVLAVTTYLGFQQRGKEEQAAQAARTEMENANRGRATALEEVRRIREVLGSDKDTADAVEAERNELFDRRFSGFDKEPKSLLRLVEWLSEAIRTKDDDIKRLEAEKVQIRKDQEAAVAQAKGLQEAAEKARDAAVAEQATQKADFDQRLAAHQQAQQEMKSKQDVALGESERTRAIVEEIAKLGPLLPTDLQRKFSAAPADGQPEPWPERVRLVLSELRARERTIKDLNATLAQLRVADPQLQEAVRKAMPDDERIDGFDGRIAAVNSRDRTVLVLCDSTAGMRPGLLLWVYGPDDPRPQVGARKGLVEIVEVEGPTLARARVRTDSSTSPILAGDGVATSLWTPGSIQEVVIVGFIRFGADRQQDRAALQATIERNGGRVVDAVTPETALVVDAGLPQPNDIRPGSGPVWRPADETVRKNALARAKETGVRVVSLDGLLDMLGLDRNTLEGRTLRSGLGSAP